MTYTDAGTGSTLVTYFESNQLNISFTIDAIDIASLITASNQSAYLTFTGATGASSSTQIISSVTFCSSPVYATPPPTPAPTPAPFNGCNTYSNADWEYIPGLNSRASLSGNNLTMTIDEITWQSCNKIRSLISFNFFFCVWKY